MPLNFSSPHAQYATTSDDDGQHPEFKNMVRALHQAGIAVVFDVVYREFSFWLRTPHRNRVAIPSPPLAGICRGNTAKCQMSVKVNSFLKFLKWLIRPLFSRTAGARRLGNAEPGFPDRGQRQNSKMNR